MNTGSRRVGIQSNPEHFCLTGIVYNGKERCREGLSCSMSRCGKGWWDSLQQDRSRDPAEGLVQRPDSSA